MRKEPHRSTYVYIPTRREIEEICSLRVVLERFVVERVIERWQPEHEEVLHQIVNEMRRAGERHDLQEVYECDYRFHFTLWEIAEHSLLLEVISSLRSRISRFLYEANSSFYQSQIHSLDSHISCHDDLIEVFSKRNVAKAQEEIVEHVLGAKERILTYCNLQ